MLRRAIRKLIPAFVVRHLKLVLFMLAARFMTLRARRLLGRSRVIVLTDSYGRLANRLTVLANVAIYANRVDAAVVDVSFIRQLGEAESLSSLQSNGVCSYPALPSRLSRLDRWCMALLRLGHDVVANRIDAVADGSVCGLPCFSGKHERKLDLEAAWVGGRSRCLLLTGINFDVRGLAEPELVFARRLLRPASFHPRAKGERSDTSAVCRIGVHVRHGDYKTWQYGRHYFPTEAYLRAIALIQGLNSGVSCQFFVVSDNPEVEHELGGLASVRWSGSSVEDDLFLLGHCDAILATNSSYARWASFIGRVPIILVDEVLKKNRVDREDFEICKFPYLGDSVSLTEPYVGDMLAGTTRC